MLGRDRVQEGLARRGVDRAGQPDAAGDPLGRDQQPRPEPARGPQRHHRRGRAVGPREVGGELEDPAHLRAAEPVDRLVRVTDDDQVAAVAGERAEQGDLAGVGVLVLVDEHVPELPAQLVAVGVASIDGAADQVGVVGGGLVVEVGEVLLEEQAGGDELRAACSCSPRATQRVASRPFSRARESTICTSRAKPRVSSARRARRPGDGLRASAQQLADHDVLLGRGEQPQRGAVERRRGVARIRP